MINRSASDYVGLFSFTSYLNFSAKNLTLDSPNIFGKSYVGSIAGFSVSGIFNNINITGGTIRSNGNYIGGITGVLQNSDASITNCSFSGNIQPGTASCIGGIAGFVTVGASVTGCTAAGNINVGENNSEYVGGIAGKVVGSSTVTNCTNNAAVKGYNYVGGIVGYTDSTSTIDHCTSSGSASVGGSSSTFTGSYYGGIVGQNYGNSTVKNCTNNSQVGNGNTNNVGGAPLNHSAPPLCRPAPPHPNLHSGGTNTYRDTTGPVLAMSRMISESTRWGSDANATARSSRRR